MQSNKFCRPLILSFFLKKKEKTKKKKIKLFELNSDVSDNEKLQNNLHKDYSSFNVFGLFDYSSLISMRKIVGNVI